MQGVGADARGAVNVFAPPMGTKMVQAHFGLMEWRFTRELAKILDSDSSMTRLCQLEWGDLAQADADEHQDDISRSDSECPSNSEGDEWKNEAGEDGQTSREANSKEGSEVRKGDKGGLNGNEDTLAKEQSQTLSSLTSPLAESSQKASRLTRRRQGGAEEASPQRSCRRTTRSALGKRKASLNSSNVSLDEVESLEPDAPF